MSTLQYEFIQTASGLSDDSIRIMLDYMRTYIVPYDKMLRKSASTTDDGTKRKIGIFKDERFLSDGYNFDESNEEIAEMFGIN